MEYLKKMVSSVGAAAVDGGARLGGATSAMLSAAMASNGKAISADFPFELGDQICSASDLHSPWSVYYGLSLQRSTSSSKASNELVSIFIAEISNPTTLILIRNSIRRLRTIRHPNILRYISSVELNSKGRATTNSESVKKVCLATEFAMPLHAFLNFFAEHLDFVERKRSFLLWLCMDLCKVSSFLNDQVNLIHALLADCRQSIMVSSFGELRLFGFEASFRVPQANSSSSPSSPSFDVAEDQILPLAIRSGLVERATLPPEMQSMHDNWFHALSGMPRHVLDSFLLADLIHRLFNAPENRLQSTMPQDLSSWCRSARHSDPRNRTSCSSQIAVLEKAGSGLLRNANLISLNYQLGILSAVADDQERDRMIHQIFAIRQTLFENVPIFFLQFRLISVLASVFETFPKAISPEGVQLLVLLGSLCYGSSNQSEHPLIKSSMASYARVVMDLFSRADRAVRIPLLEHFDTVFVGLFDQSIVQEGIYVHLVSGFGDANPHVRDLTLRRSVLLADKLTTRQLNGELIKFYCRLQGDPQIGVRVNAIICIAKVVPMLKESTVVSCLGSSMAKGLRDLSGAVRSATLRALCATSDAIPVEEVAKGILPLICTLMVDSNSEIRSLAIGLAHRLLNRVEQHAHSLPVDSVPSSPTIKEDIASVQPVANAPLESTTISNNDGWDEQDLDVSSLNIDQPPSPSYPSEDNPWSANLSEQPSSAAAAAANSAFTVNRSFKSSRPMSLNASHKP